MSYKIVFSSNYEGPRYTYRSPLRPVSQLWLPDETIRVIITGQSDREVTLTELLPARLVSQFSLELIEQKF